MSSVSFPHLLIRASAGSGKTHQLTNRYLGLLAAGVEPEAILATTFTRKAAGEILNRVLWRLAQAAGDAQKADDLDRQLGAAGRSRADFVALLRRMVQCLHRARIGTLDSFYLSLAGSFSLELGLPAGWSICEEIDDAVLRRQAVEALLARDQGDAFIGLYRRLTRGETKRSVDGELLDIVQTLYAIHQETTDDVWQKVGGAAQLSAGELQALAASIEAFDLSENPGMEQPRADDLERLRAAEWQGLLENGLCNKVLTGENAFRNKPIPDELVVLYRQLIDHLRGVVVEPIAEQTKATREFLNRFHGELWALKQTAAGLRFEELTGALARELSRQTLEARTLAFRLDGAVEHLLLDEFQDTSLPQWRVLAPLAQAIVHESPTPNPEQNARSFFCVGDVKQAIYRWRGGMADIFLFLPRFFAKLEENPLDASRRSAPPIIETVNTVFLNLAKVETGDKAQPGLNAWNARFQRHVTTKSTAPGYACLRTGPAQANDQGVDEQRGQHVQHVAEHIGSLCAAAPGRTIGVLCRTNETVARMIYELRQRGIEASEEGGNPLTDSPAVENMLSLFTIADHPGHSVAWFHLKNSPLAEALRAFHEPDQLARHLRCQILADGIGKVTHAWAEQLAPYCNRRDLSRLQQLIEAAYDFQSRSTLRADDFVASVRLTRVPDPSSADVRVMTIHGAKGLQFDIVVLPELDAELVGRKQPSFVVDRDADTLAVTLVCRYANETVQALLTPRESRAFELDRRQRVEESLSLLYVAMTRAMHALYLFIPGKRLKRQSGAWHNLLLQTLTPPVTEPHACSQLYECGAANWYEQLEPKGLPLAASRPAPAPIPFRQDQATRRRGLQHVAPSHREGGGHIRLDRLFQPGEAAGMAAGTLFHAWFETIEWLDNGAPTEAVLRDAALAKRWELPADTWRDLDRLLAEFRQWLRNPDIEGILRRSAYADPKHVAFPQKLAHLFTKTLVPQRIERERRFLVRDGETFLSGSVDRIVWLSDEGRIIAADLIDFKTDKVEPGNESAFAERTEFYRPQLDAYRRAVSRLADLPAEHVAARLVFTFAGRVVEI